MYKTSSGHVILCSLQLRAVLIVCNNATSSALPAAAQRQRVGVAGEFYYLLSGIPSSYCRSSTGVLWQSLELVRIQYQGRPWYALSTREDPSAVTYFQMFTHCMLRTAAARGIIQVFQYYAGTKMTHGPCQQTGQQQKAQHSIAHVNAHDAGLHTQ